MKHATVIDSDTGGFILADAGAGETFDASLAAALNIVFDPDGKTSAISGHEGDSWPDVVLKARDAVKAIVDNRLAVVIAAEGYLYVTVQDHPLTAAELSRVQSTHRLGLVLPSGTALLTDGMFLFDEDGREHYDIDEIAVEPGAYTVEIHAMLPDPEVVPTVGVCGDDESPAAIIVLTKNAEVDDAAIDVRLDMSAWTLAPVSGAICAVTVTKISGDDAHADIQLTSHVRSGKARFTVPDEARVAVGDEPWVLLERDTGHYWTASLIEHGD